MKVKSLSFVSGLSNNHHHHDQGRRRLASVTPKSSLSVVNGLHGTSDGSRDEMFLRLRREAVEVVKREPILGKLLSKVGLLDASSLPDSNQIFPYPAIAADQLEPASSFEEAVSRIVSHRLSSCSGGDEAICPSFLRHLIERSFGDAELELGHTMGEAVREDALAILRRDPACETLLEAVLFMKGFHSLVIHRAARRAWRPAKGGAGETNNGGISVAGKRFVALLLQSQAASAFGVDIHPACSIGAGVMIDHATGVVIGETATVGDGATILHGVTLGGTGKDHGDRHPKVGRDVLIGAGTKILGNITVGDRAKIGAGSVVLRPIPGGATAVGAPAKIIGYTPKGERPGSSVDMKLEGVEPLLGKGGSASSGSTAEPSTDSKGSAGTDAATPDPKAKQLPRKVESNVSEQSQEPMRDKGGGADDKDPSDNGGNGEGEDEDNDDDVTDFGTPAKLHWVKVSNGNDGLCPFSGSFRELPPAVNQKFISHAELRALLIQEGCTEGECVEVFFELLRCTPADSDARQCGCIPMGVFLRRFPEVAEGKTRLDPGTALALARGDLRALGMSKKASRRFRPMLSALYRQALASLPKIPSCGSLNLTPPHSPGRERNKGHVDTAAYAEGIKV